MQIRILNAQSNLVIDSWDTASSNLDGFLTFINKWGLILRVNEIIQLHTAGKIKLYDMTLTVNLSAPVTK